jgi:hypothetical protein
MAAKRNVFLEQKFTKSFDEIKKNQVSVLTHASVPVTDLMGKHDAADYGHVFTEQGYHTSSDLAEDFAWLVLELSHDVPVDVLQSMFGKLTHTEGPYEKNTFMGYSARENSAVARLMGARGKMVR